MLLKSILIEEFLIINKVEILFEDGLTVISGESGAGKSTIIDAICWCLGFDNKRTKDIKGKVKLVFNRDITISRKGKSLFKLNDQKITKKNLLKMNFITICRQDHRFSFSATQDFRETIDKLLIDKSNLEQLKTIYINYQSIIDEINSLKALDDEDIEYSRNAVLEIKSLNLDKYSEEILVTQRREEIDIFKSNESLIKAMQVLKGHSGIGIVSQINNLTKYLTSNSPTISLLQQRVEYIANELYDIESSIDTIISCSSSNEARLDMIDKKLSLIRDVARKYRVKPHELQSLLEKYQTQVLNQENLIIKQQELYKRLTLIKTEFHTISENLNRSRQAICNEINIRIKAILDELMMSNIDLNFELYKCKSWNEFGDIEIKINYGKRVLSGGEMSRLLLAIKIATATLDIPIIFDEIDLGIGGITAHRIGNKLRQLGDLGQVIVVTHQAQVAAHGLNHICVSRDDVIQIEHLSINNRINEIARMISGSKTTPESLSAAKKLLEECRE